MHEHTDEPASALAPHTGSTAGEVPKARRVAADRLPVGLAPLVIQTLHAAPDTSYGIVSPNPSVSSARDLEAPNRQHGFTTHFTPGGVTIRPDVAANGSGAPLEFHLAAYGTPASLHPIGMGVWKANGLRAERTGGEAARPLVEWYVNGPLGLEHGFTVAAPPDDEADSIVLELAVGRGWHARAAGDDAIALEEIGGPGRLRYAHLAAVDAAGAVLPASMTVSADRIAIHVAGAGAQYPVTIDPVFQTQLTASDGAAGDFFGVSVAVSGDTAVVGASLDDLGGSGDRGSAYVFVRNGTVWSEQAKLAASDGAAGDRFGASVAISGETVVVGAPNDTVGANAGQGSAYVFVRSGTTWTQQQQLTASDGAALDDFGVSVGLDGDTVIVGADLDDVEGRVDQGSAYVFVRSETTWSAQGHLDSTGGSLGGAAGDKFGHSVAVNGDEAFVGAPEADVAGPVNRGSAHEFQRLFGQWKRNARFVGDAAGDEFGTSVAVGPDVILIGAPGYDAGSNPDQGKVHVHPRPGSMLGVEADLTATDGAANDRFGSAVAIGGNTAVVGAPGRNSFQGAAYVFAQTSLTGWSAGTRMTANNGAANDFFGTGAAVSGDVVLVGAYQGDVGAIADLGAAYVFVNNLPTITPIANQTIPEDTATGALPFTVDDVETSAASLIVYASYQSCCSPGPTIVLGGSGASWTITVTPTSNLNESTTFSVLVSDGEATTVTTFTVTTTAVNDAPTITTVANQTTSKDTATSALTFSVADVESSVSSLTMSGSSSVTTLVPNANITFGGFGASRTVTVTPAANQIGTTTITLSVSDGAATTPTTFTLRVGSYAPFTDDELTAGSSVVRVAHIAELRTRIDTLRQGAGLTPYSYTGSTLIAGSTGILSVLDLRAALQDVHVARGVAIPVYTDPELPAGTAVKAAHIAQLRAAVIALE